MAKDIAIDWNGIPYPDAAKDNPNPLSAISNFVFESMISSSLFLGLLAFVVIATLFRFFHMRNQKHGLRKKTRAKKS